MDNYTQMCSVTATYKPQDGQKFRCSSNFSGWDTKSGRTLKFVVTTNDGYPMPTFSITHDKHGSDKTWYTGISDGVVVAVDSQEGEGGKHDIYVGTTSDLNPEFKGNETYTVTVYQSNS